ncbi:MAG: hypothetical protein U1F61_31300 [Opitutaceae bacterium]
MKTLKHLLIATLFAGLSSLGVHSDDKGREPDSVTVSAPKEGKAKPYPLNFCVVSDEKFEGSDMKPVEMVYEGQTMKFCCKSCVKDFKKDPKKFLTKLADEEKKIGAAAKK